MVASEYALKAVRHENMNCIWREKEADKQKTNIYTAAESIFDS